MLAQLAIGLREPHQLALVHRDIKPDNIFLCGTEDGPRVKLLDFGSVRDNSAGAKKLTMVGTTIGSPFYMSPEQAQGLQDLDQRADVWSIAAIAYEALTGKVPFYGATGPQILLAILGKEPTPPSILTHEDGFDGAKVPEGLDDVLADALCKNAAIRIASVAELADRFGHAYGLAGDHLEWAELAEAELATRLESARRVGGGASIAPKASSLAPLGPSGSEAIGAVSGGGPRVGEVEPGVFDEDDQFVMGLPDETSSTRIYVIVGIVVVLLIGGGVAMFLR
jgi:serine/threonine-protein kinase